MRSQFAAQEKKSQVSPFMADMNAMIVPEIATERHFFLEQTEKRFIYCIEYLSEEDLSKNIAPSSSASPSGVSAFEPAGFYQPGKTAGRQRIPRHHL